MSAEPFPGGVFARTYRWMLAVARHRHAEAWLGMLSFAESSVFPIPPDVMLAPMVLARPARWLWLASLTTAASVLGGMLGYAIGHFAIELALPVVERVGYAEAYHTAVDWFARYGVAAVFVAGFTPIPYKLFTIASGAAAMAFVPFVLASLVGRGLRFYLVAGLVRAIGPRIEPVILRNINLFGWLFLALLIGGFAWFLR
jgi:membrane protein YqaA with SNARE-associated domain